jgi:alcohol dehydrogenase class IV
MTFEFATAGRVIFGRGTVTQLPALARESGRRAMVVTGSNPQRHAGVLAHLLEAGLEITRFPVSGEPTTGDILRGVDLAQTENVELVIGLGGGSVVDAAKAIAAMATQPGNLFDYLEVIGRGQPLDRPPLPHLAVPTTAGTGAEVTRNAVLASPEHGLKVSLRHHSMLPTVALIDPELARDCPPPVTAASGMDALVQCLEAYVSRKAQPMTDALCLEGIRRAVRSLEAAVADGSDLDAREDLALAALFSGIALANAGLGAVHGFAAPLGGQFHAPHGAVCAALLAPVWAANLKKLRAQGDGAALARFEAIARLLPTGSNHPEAEDAATYFRDLSQRLAIPPLRHYGIQETDHLDLARKAAASSSMRGNPVELDQEELLGILRGASPNQS